MRPEHWITIGIASSPAIGYGLAYFHERGICAEYGIPHYLIHIGITSVLFSVSTVIICLLGAASIYYIGFVMLRSGGKRIKKAFARLILMISPVAALAIIFRYVWEEWYQLVIAYFLAWIIFEVCSYIRQRKKKTTDYLELFNVNKLPGQRLYIIFVVVLIIFACVLSSQQGKADALMQDKFFVPSTNENSIVLRIYGDNMVCVEGESIETKENENIETKFRITGDLFILSVDGDPNLTLTLKYVGAVQNN